MTAIATPTLEIAKRTPVSAGPARVLTCSTQLATTFVAVSSSGTRARDGVTAACVGRVMVTAVAATVAHAYTT